MTMPEAKTRTLPLQPMRQQRPRSMVVERLLMSAIVGTMATVIMQAAPGIPFSPPRDLFDEIYARSRGIEASLKTVTARFTETTTSSLLSRPLVAHGTLAVQRPSKIVLHYTEPEQRTLLIDQDRLTLAWPSRGVPHQTRHGRFRTIGCPALHANAR